MTLIVTLLIDTGQLPCQVIVTLDFEQGITMTEPTRLRIAPKELEALMWGLAQISDVHDRVPNDPQDPLAVLLGLGYERGAIMEACTETEEQVYMLTISEPLSAIERDILRVCVESSSWVRAYIELGPAGGTENDARATLRGLAHKLDESFGIECNFIANN